jgi:hypothetical protein
MQLVDSNGNLTDDAGLRAAFPFTSFPLILTQEMVQPFGYSVLALTQAPTPPNQYYTVSEGAPTQVNGVWTQTWVQTAFPLSSAQSNQVQSLSNSCKAAIVNGFTSSALGSAYTYPSEMTDQHNMQTAAIVAGLPTNPQGWTTQLWCANSSGVWAYVAHTPAQAQQVVSDWQKNKDALQSQYANLVAQVNASTVETVDQVAAIVWTVPTSS